MAGSRQTRFRGYRLAGELADELHAAVATWEAFERWSVGIQLVRATDSIGANAELARLVNGLIKSEHV